MRESLGFLEGRSVKRNVDVHHYTCVQLLMARLVSEFVSPCGVHLMSGAGGYSTGRDRTGGWRGAADVEGT